MKYLISTFVLFAWLSLMFPMGVWAATPKPARAQTALPSASASATPTATPTITPSPRADITVPNIDTTGPLEKLIKAQKVGPMFANPLKYLIRSSVANGVPANTLVLLLLLPIVAAFIAAARHLVGLQGFGILLPAALAVTFLAVGPVVGLGLFLVIVGGTTLSRIGLRRIKLRLHYLPRMSLLLTFTVLFLMIVLLIGSSINLSGITNVSIFPVLFLVVLSEDFTRVQLGKSFRSAINITTQTLILALVSYIFLTFDSLQKWALLNPEGTILGVVIFDILLGKFSGLRFLEYYRFRKLIKK